MADKSPIEWTDATWPIVQGCDPVSPGCVNCYAVPLLWRLAHNPNPVISGPLQGLVEQHVNRGGETILRFTGKLALRHDRLDWPLKWKEPRKIFVPSHGDIFHEDVPAAFLDQIFAIMALCPQHTFQVLTKRSKWMRAYAADATAPHRIARAVVDLWLDGVADAPKLEAAGTWPVRSEGDPENPSGIILKTWPLPNVWLGVSTEDQARADERIPDLLAMPAAVRFISAEPLLGPIDVTALSYGGWPMDALRGTTQNTISNEYPIDRLDWVIAGGESGPNASPMHVFWVRGLRDQCAAAGVPFFFKQWGEWWCQECHEAGTFRKVLEIAGIKPSRTKPARGCWDAQGIWRPDSIAGAPPAYTMWKVGKNASGRHLAGRIHDDMPGRSA